MALAESYAKMTGPQETTATTIEGGGIGGGIQAMIGTLLPYYMMSIQKKEQNKFLENLMKFMTSISPTAAPGEVPAGAASSLINNMPTLSGQDWGQLSPSQIYSIGGGGGLDKILFG